MELHLLSLMAIVMAQQLKMQHISDEHGFVQVSLLTFHVEWCCSPNKKISWKIPLTKLVLLGSLVKHCNRQVVNFFQADNDADVLIVQTAIESARFQETIAVENDTDLLVLLLYHTRMDLHDIFLAPKARSTSTKNNLWCIQQSQKLLDTAMCENILFIHAIVGCDVTSWAFGLGEGLAFKKIKERQFS